MIFNDARQVAKLNSYACSVCKFLELGWEGDWELGLGVGISAISLIMKFLGLETAKFCITFHSIERSYINVFESSPKSSSHGFGGVHASLHTPSALQKCWWLKLCNAFWCSCWLLPMFLYSVCGLQSNKLVAESSFNISNWLIYFDLEFDFDFFR